jgi:co-chaperonin GroES (HSP10)
MTMSKPAEKRPEEMLAALNADTAKILKTEMAGLKQSAQEKGQKGLLDGEPKEPRATSLNLKPTGYYALVKMEVVEQTVSEGSLKGFVLQSNAENEREQSGHDVGILISLGPTAFSGYQGCDANTSEERASQWGVSIGDKVEFNRYDGKIPSHPDFQDYRIITDSHIIGTIED